MPSKRCLDLEKLWEPEIIRGYSEFPIDVNANKNTLNCTLSQGVFITLLPSNKRLSEIYSMLLSANIAEKRVRLRIKDGSAECELIYAQLRSQ